MIFQRAKNARDRIIVALDVADEAGLLALVRGLSGQVGLFKIGKELFTAMGPRAVELVHQGGGRVFLDLKYHDIPNTVGGAVRAAARLGVSMLTVHASGGLEMLKAAVGASEESDNPPAILAVTVLTSLTDGDLGMLGVADPVPVQVERLARLSVSAGVHGLVLSPQEVRGVRAAVGASPLIVTPGVRPVGTSMDDQARVATPGQAVANGADFLVIGRPITRAADPREAVATIVGQLTGGQEEG